MKTHNSTYKEKGKTEEAQHTEQCVLFALVVTAQITRRAKAVEKAAQRDAPK